MGGDCNRDSIPIERNVIVFFDFWFMTTNWNIKVTEERGTTIRTLKTDAAVCFETLLYSNKNLKYRHVQVDPKDTETHEFNRDKM